VPKLDDTQLSNEFNMRFNQFAEKYGLSMVPEQQAAFDKEFNPHWKPVFRPVLSNLRKLNTYFNALNSSFSLVQHEVNLIDFMFIELLREIDPEIYEQIFRNRTLFYYPEWDIARWDERQVAVDAGKEEETLHSKYDKIFQNLHGTDRDLTLRLVARLFPKVAQYTKTRRWGMEVNTSENEANKQKRIYHPDYFMIYFSLHVEEGYISTEEMEGSISSVNRLEDASRAQEYFIEYLRDLNGMKRYRFFERMIRFADKLERTQTKALANAIALDAEKFEHDDLEIGEFGTAIRLILVLANRLNDSPETTALLCDVIGNASTDALAKRVFLFSTDRENNEIFKRWDYVNTVELQETFVRRMKAKYHKGGKESIYSHGMWRDWQALITWYRVGDQEKRDVRAYLADEFDRRPSSIGKHIGWLWNSVGNPDGRKVVDDLFPLSSLAELAKANGPNAYSNASERQIVESLISQFVNSAASSNASHQ
jgi:hypothetical protein